MTKNILVCQPSAQGNEQAGMFLCFQVSKVNYPGLTSHPQHALVQKVFVGGCGGVFSFEMHGGVEAAEQFLQVCAYPACSTRLHAV